MGDSPGRLLIDDRLLIEYLLVGLKERGDLHTTSYWYYRACRAAVAGAGGHLSGPFAKLGEAHQRVAIRSLLVLPSEIVLPEARSIVPIMARLAERHPRLNVLNLEATAAAVSLDATVLLSAEAIRGVLPRVLDAEHIPWRAVDLD